MAEIEGMTVPQFQLICENIPLILREERRQFIIDTYYATKCGSAFKGGHDALNSYLKEIDGR